MTRFAASCDRLWDSLSAISTLSVGREPGAMTLNRRGERMFAYLCARRRRAAQDERAT